MLSILFALAMALSALVALTSAVVGDAENVVEPETALGEDPVLPEVAGPAVDRPLWPTPLTRDAMRAWAEKAGLPTAEIGYLGDREAPFFDTSRVPGVITPQDANETMMTKADQAHAAGFTGEGVRVAVIDTGIDMAHPDLFNVSARVMAAGSPYFLHPIAYDGASLNDYLVFGEPSPTLADGSNWPSNSWYVNTSYNTTVGELGDGTRWVNWTDGTLSLSWNVTDVSGLSAGEEVRVGFHPDDALLALFGIRPGLLLYNDTGAGAPFDSIVVDLDTDGSMNDEKRAWVNTDWASFDPEAELIFQDLNSDGVQDVSGGMVTFIADGVREIPYASHQIDALNFTFQTLNNDNSFDIWDGLTPEDHLVPDNGDLVVLFGDFNGPGANGAHGTWVTSAITGQGLTGGGSVGPVLAGQAPDAKIIASGNNFGGTDPFGQMGLWTALIFATEGYDGIPASDDHAHIASNSWGSTTFTGWAWGSRFADYVSSIHGDERTLFVFAAGNSGPGYGGRQGPAGGASLLVAGAHQNFNYRDDPWYMFDGGPNAESAWGDTASLSSRGPSAMGRHYMDATTDGEFGYGADPLNNNPFVGDSGGSLNGSSSWVLWSGTSLATPNLSGVTALIYDAYMEGHGGSQPLSPTAKGLVKNSADDARQDPFLAGAGKANAFRGVKLGNETDGISLDLHEWYPGDYRGTAYDAYANLLDPGTADMRTVTVSNHRSSSMDVDIDDVVYTKSGSLNWTFDRVAFTAPDQWLLNGTGVMATNGTVLIPDLGGLFDTADFIRVTMFFDGSRLDEFPGPAYLLRVFDWTDVDANGSSEGFSERNLLVQDWLAFLNFHGPNGYVQVHDPANRSHDGLIIYLNPVQDVITGPVEMTVVVDYYERTDWDWVSLSTESLTIAGGSTDTVDITVTVPAEAPPGLYEGVTRFTDDTGNVTTLPIVVNVPSPLPMSFGDDSEDASPYQQGSTYGKMWDAFDPVASGDFRYYFTDLIEPANVTVTLEWESDASTAEIYVLGHRDDWFGDNAGFRFGPGTLSQVATSAAASNATSVIAELPAGLAAIVVRGTFLAGIAPVENFTGQAGAFTILPRPWIEEGIPVDGSETFLVTSGIDLPDFGLTVETGEVLFFEDQPVDSFPYGGQDPFELYLFQAPNRLEITLPINVQRATFTLFFHSGASDVDMGVFYDNDCDGSYTLDDDVIGTAASTSANPESATVLDPPPGCYWVHAAGFTVEPSGGLYDLTVEIITAPIVFPADLPDALTAGVPDFMTLDYVLPHVPKTFGGELFLGSSQFPKAMNIPIALTPDLPPEFSGITPAPGAVTGDATPPISVDLQDAQDPYETAVDTSSVTVWLDGSAVTDPNVVTVTSSSVSLGLPADLADGSHTVSVFAADMNTSANQTSWSFTVDTAAPALSLSAPTESVTNDPNVTVSGTTEPGATLTVDGNAVTVAPSGLFTTTLSLAEGAHALEVVATDPVGNSASTEVEIEVDLTAPAVSIDSPGSGSTVSVATVRVTGSVEAGASLEVNGVQPAVASDGSFSFELALAEGSNTITATATDAAGNVGTDSVSVTFDNPVPTLQENLDTTQNDLDAAEADLQIARDNLGFLQTLVYVLLGVIVVVGAVAVVGFLLYWMERQKGA